MTNPTSHLGEAPLWRRARARELGSTLRGPERAEVAIVGAGITGLTLALLLQREGTSVVLLEADRVGAGATGASSAHVTSVLDVPYRSLLDKLGHVRASELVAGSGRALEFVRGLAHGSGACSFDVWPAYRYAEDASGMDELRDELEAARELGVPAILGGDVPLPFPVAGALQFPRQGAFDPVEYLELLANLFMAAGGRLHEGARVERFEEDSEAVVLEATGGLVTAEHAVLATHTPLGVSLLHAQLEARRSYVLAFRTSSPVAGGLFWDTEDPYHYLRPVRYAGQDLMLVGGEDHRVGTDEPADRYAALEAFVRARFAGVEIVRRWSAQLYEPADALPFVGRSPLSDRVHVATGFSGTGLVLGTLSAHLLADSLLDRPATPLAELLKATRLPSLAAAGKAAREGLGTAARFVGDRLGAGDGDSLASLAPGGGAILEVAGEKLAVHRDDAGRLHAVSPVCTHMGCIVGWNPAERSWDCPCHGGRYGALGKVVSGPPTRDLEARALPDEPA